MNEIHFTKAPQNYQIFQHINGFAEIELQGVFKTIPAIKGTLPSIRVVEEDTNVSVIPWQEAECSGNKWRIVLRVPRGGLYRIETTFLNSPEWFLLHDIVEHIGVGDLFVIAGQSNAVGYGKGADIWDAPALSVHLFKIRGEWALASHPFNDTTGYRGSICYDSGLTGPFLTFGKRLNSKLSYPIGFIPCAVGGSNISSWVLREDGSFFRAMEERIKACGGKVSAMLWYQGCSDTDSPEKWEKYEESFKAFLEDVNNNIAKDLPIYTFQLNSSTDMMEERNEGFSVVRDIQRRAAEEYKNVFVVPSFGSVLGDSIHNNSSANITLGNRLATIVLGSLYGFPYPCAAPAIAKATCSNKKEVVLEFSNVLRHIYCCGVKPETLPFLIEDAGGVVQICEYSLEGNIVILRLSRDIIGSGTVSALCGENPGSIIPKDMDTQLPILGFYKFPIN